MVSLSSDRFQNCIESLWTATRGLSGTAAPSADEHQKSLDCVHDRVDLDIFICRVGVSTAWTPQYRRNSECLMEHVHVARPFNANDRRLLAGHFFSASRQFFNKRLGF